MLLVNYKVIAINKFLIIILLKFYIKKIMKISLENSFPGKTNSVEITEEMCDLNGHMNVLYYNQILSFGIDEFYSVETVSYTHLTLPTKA